MHNDLAIRVTGIAATAAPLMLLGSTLAYITAGNGLGDGEIGGAIQVAALITFAIAVVGLARQVEPSAPTAATVLTVLGLVGTAGGVGYGIDSIQAAVFDTGSIDESGNVLGALALQLPGIVFPLSLAALGLVLVHTRTVPRPLGVLLSVGALLFPASRIPGIALLAVVSDVLVVVAMVPIGLRLLIGTRPVTTAAPQHGAVS